MSELTDELKRLKRRVEILENAPWLHPKDVMSVFGISKSTLYRWISCRKLPRPSRIYGPIWRRSDLAKCKAGQKPHH